MTHRHTMPWIIGEMSVNGQPAHAPSVPIVITSDEDPVAKTESSEAVDDIESAPPSLVRRRPLSDTGYRFVAEALDESVPDIVRLQQYMEGVNF